MRAAHRAADLLKLDGSGGVSGWPGEKEGGDGAAVLSVLRRRGEQEGVARRVHGERGGKEARRKADKGDGGGEGS